MTTLRYCHIHGSFRADYPDSCPSCDLDEFAREERAEAREANETYKRNNPGDYTCPNCLYTTLKSGAPRCPKCQGTVEADYWFRVRADEKAKALADQERERTRKAEEAAEEARAQAEWVSKAPEREEEELRRASNRRLAEQERQIRESNQKFAYHTVAILSAILVVAAMLGLALLLSRFANQHVGSPTTFDGCLQGMLRGLAALGVIVFGGGLYIVVPLASLFILVHLVMALIVAVRRTRIR